jgi:hypothetical protein
MSLQIYGTASDMILQMTRQFAKTGTPPSVQPEYVGGFVRLAERQANDCARGSESRVNPLVD